MGEMPNPGARSWVSSAGIRAGNWGKCGHEEQRT